MEKELFGSIIDIYGREVFTLGELLGILGKCGFSTVEARSVIREAINARVVGRVKFQKLRRNMPSRHTVVVLSVKNRNKSEYHGKI